MSEVQPTAAVSKQPLIGGHPADTVETVSATPPPGPTPVYNGVGGTFQTPEQLATYTKSLEDLLIQQKLNTMGNSANAIAPAAPIVAQAAPVDPDADLSKQIQDAWFSDPEKASSLLEQKLERKSARTNAAEQQRKDYFKQFYTKNTHFVGSEPVVDLIVKANSAEISTLKTKEQCDEYLERKVNEVIKPFESRFGKKETVLPSGAAVSFPSSGEPVSTPGAVVASGPQSLSDQILQLNRRRRKN